MRVLIVHPEAEYFAGAEKVLGYFLQGAAGTEIQVTVAAVRESRVPEIVPEGIGTCWVPPNPKFSLLSFWKQIRTLSRLSRVAPFDLVHGWAARDWELTAALGKLTGRPALGTLHDHPRAAFISSVRQRLMRGAASVALEKVVCVSEAVRQACVAAGYPKDKLAVVHNGLPVVSSPARPSRPPPFRIGYLGQFSERKGLRGLFAAVDHLSGLTDLPWELSLAGDAQDERGREMVRQLKEEFAPRPWWPRVEWRGWVKRPGEFLAELDLLVCPSLEFDPFPTVLLEAGQAGVPVLGARLGGIPEIIEDGKTGWLFEPSDWREGAETMKRLMESPGLVLRAGSEAKKRVEREFTIKRMVTGYLNVYKNMMKLQD